MPLLYTVGQKTYGCNLGPLPKAGSAELDSAAAVTVLTDEKVIAVPEIERETDSYRE